MHQSGYYDMDNNVVIGDNNSGDVDVLNTTPFSVRDILNIANQNSVDESAYHDPLNTSSDLFAQKLYGNNCGGAYGSGAQYKRWKILFILQFLLKEQKISEFCSLINFLDLI
jgi:hypothetical protein